MENDSNINENFINNVENKFEMEFFGQNLKKNESFIKWQNGMKKIYGNNAKLFQCQKDKTFYYASSSDCKKYPLYKRKCPICNNSICYFCLKYTNDNCDFGNCCVYRRIICLFLQDAFVIINKKYDDFYEIFKFFIIPLFSAFFFIGLVSACFFYKLKLANDKSNNGYLLNYEDHLENNMFIFKVVVAINVAFAIMLSIPLFLLDIYFKIFLIIISIFSKNYPMKYYFGMLDTMGLS